MSKKNTKKPTPAQKSGPRLVALRDEADTIKRFVEHAALWFGPVGANQPQVPAWLRDAATARLTELEQQFRQARDAAREPAREAAPSPAPVVVPAVA